MKHEDNESYALLDLPVLIALLVVFLVIVWQPAGAAEPDYKLGLTLVPWSHHNDIENTNVTNEKHGGVGLSLTLPTTDHQLLSVTYGLMHYTNSYGDKGPLLSAGLETTRPLFAAIHYGVAVGIAPAYLKSDHSPLIGWLSFRYGWVSVITAPSVATAVLFTIPLN